MTARYTKIAILLHWLIALGIFAMFALGWFMGDIPKKAPDQSAFNLFDLGVWTWQVAEPMSPRAFYFNLHKSLGVTVLALIVIRMLWRFTHRPPAPLSHYTALEKKLATGTHHLMYMLMLAVPLSGLMMSIYSKYGVMFFGSPFISGINNEKVSDIFEKIHEPVGIILLIVVGIHIAGALKHKFIDKDETINRMLP